MKLELLRADVLENVRAFLYTAIKAHIHLDWVDPLSFLEQNAGYLLMDGDAIIALAIMPNAPVGVKWCRAFYHCGTVAFHTAWREFWERYLLLDQPRGVILGVMDPRVSARDVLIENGFIAPTEVVTLRRSLSNEEDLGKYIGSITRMDQSSAEMVEGIDKICFPPIWRFTLRSIQKGLSVPGICTKMTIEGKVIGYQISNFGYSSIHLARLAVLPEYQGKGYAKLILKDLLKRSLEYNVYEASVNTQSDNQASLRLYEKFGFRLTPNTVSLMIKEIK